MTGASGGAGRERPGGRDADTAPIPRVEPGASARPERSRRWGEDHSPEQLEQAKRAWRDAMPWEHPMSRGDKVLVFSTLGVVLLMVATLPVRPFLLASHPIALTAATGSLSAIGAGAAFARIGEGELWLVIAAGVFGMIKFDWLFWLAGRRWGAKIIQWFAPGDFAKGVVSRIGSWPSWAMPVAVAASALPGIPSPAVFALAGLGGMRLVPFLIFDAIGAALIAGLVAGLGYGVGQHAVDIVLMIDEYALWVTLALVVVVWVRTGFRGHQQDRAKKARGATVPPRS